MGNKVFYGIIAVLIAGVVGTIALSGRNKPPEEILGVEHADQGTKHVEDGMTFNYNSNPPSTGDHFQIPATKGFYEQELSDGNVVHSLEHGYVWVTYKPDLPKDQIEKLKGLFSEPFSDPKFTPSKAIISLRSKNTAPISIVSWRWTMDLQSFDEQKLKKFYLQHVSKSPEGAAQ